MPLLDAAGYKHSMVSEVGSSYISCARSIMLKKALDAKADIIVFIDHDVSWEPEDLVTLIKAEGDCVCGNYRYKREPEEYMGVPYPDMEGTPQVRGDGAVKGYWIPAGFLKITRSTVNRFITNYPDLCYGEKCSPHVDLFNHGAWNGVWYGEDYSFSRRWRDMGGEIYILPRLRITHHTTEKAYPGNFHEYLMRQPGGSNDPARTDASQG